MAVLLFSLAVVKATDMVKETIEGSFQDYVIRELAESVDVDNIVELLEGIDENLESGDVVEVLEDIDENLRVLSSGIPNSGSHKLVVNSPVFEEKVFRPMPFGKCSYVFYVMDEEDRIYGEEDFGVTIAVSDGSNIKDKSDEWKGKLEFDEKYPLVWIKMDGKEVEETDKQIYGVFEYRC